MSADPQGKVDARHLKRQAYLYVRQSSLRQVLENTESTERQYALKQRALALGWTQERIIVVDTDLGQSGASSVDREGFQRLVTDVGLGRAGIVMGLEVSRLARNNADWHRLLEICALADTLILDEDGIYDPAHFNDRLLLGLKGTMSEAELHLLRARLIGGMMNKARRGELLCTAASVVSGTSACTSSEARSTIVTTEPRVRLLPPCELGDTTSPTSASLRTTTPSKGART
jgi:DNA invertase Pin-like site-specific DNA recombinase